MVLLLLLDAFRPDYLECTPFLRYLAASGLSGRFQEPFGFAPRASYFAGLTPGEAGYSHQFWYDPAASPFRAARHYPDSRKLSPLAATLVREQVRKAAALETTPYAADYIHPLEIPSALLPFFDAAEKYSPWDGRCGYPSIFHEMEAERRQWLYAGWPVISNLGLRSDGSIVSWVLRHARPEHELVHLQFCELDSVAHLYGPESSEVLQCLEETDRLVRILVEGLARLGGTQHQIVFGDHGMLPVIIHVDLESGIRALSSRSPEEFVYFLDSTGARFWYHSEAARSEVRAWLRSLTGGKLLSESELADLGMQGIDKRNGEDYWVADAGVLVNPNFFHSGAEPPVGMHGYAPEEPDNQGLFIVAGPSIPSGASAGVVTADILHKFLRTLVLSKGTTHDIVGKAHPNAHERIISEQIDRDLSLVCSRIEARTTGFVAIVLCGAFGRGEGSVLVEDGRARALNDYDLVILGDDSIGAIDWKQESDELKAALRVPYLDIGWMPSDSLLRPEPTIFNYEFRRGSRVLRGDAGWLDRMPLLAAGEIPSAEVLRLLLNRITGVLIGLRGDLLALPRLSSPDSEFLWLQIIKLAVAVADHHLFKWGAYHVKYAERRRRFGTLGRSAQIPGERLAAIDLCFALKLKPDHRLSEDPRPLLRTQANWWRQALSERLGDHDSPDASSYVRTRGSDRTGRQEKIRGCAPLLWESLTDSLRPNPERLDVAANVMSEAGIVLPSPSAEDPSDRFEQLRSAYISAWEMTCH